MERIYKPIVETTPNMKTSENMLSDPVACIALFKMQDASIKKR